MTSAAGAPVFLFEAYKYVAGEILHGQENVGEGALGVSYEQYVPFST